VVRNACSGYAPLSTARQRLITWSFDGGGCPRIGGKFCTGETRRNHHFRTNKSAQTSGFLWIKPSSMIIFNFRRTNMNKWCGLRWGYCKWLIPHWRRWLAPPLDRWISLAQICSHSSQSCEWSRFAQWECQVAPWNKSGDSERRFIWGQMTQIFFGCWSHLPRDHPDGRR
jgi:hypothetical protein